jgi:signal peptidase II
MSFVLRQSRNLGFVIAVFVFGIDRLSKWVIETRVGFFDTFKVIPGFFDIVRSTNRGVAFGIFNDSNSEWRTRLLILGTLAACAAVSAMLWKAERLDRTALWGLAFILGGAAGNLFDRIVFGRVTDFLLLYLGSYQWPTFNIADSAIVIGSCLLILDQLRGKKHQTAHVS